MSMILVLSPLSDPTIERLAADPPLVWQLVFPEDPEAYERARREASGQRRPGFFSRLFGEGSGAGDAPPAEPAPLTLGEGEGASVELDKAWHGIHFLLTGTAWEGDPPLAFLVAGGRTIGEEDVGYGPPRAFTAAQVREIAAALEPVSDDELRRRFAPSRMMELEIYPEIWDRDPAEDDTLGYLIDHMAVLRGALSAAVAKGYGMLVVLA